MTITAAIVLFAVIWFLTLFVVLPIGLRTQGEDGEVVPGTPSSAPANPRLRRKFFWVTLIAAGDLGAALRLHHLGRRQRPRPRRLGPDVRRTRRAGCDRNARSKPASIRATFARIRNSRRRIA